MKFLNLILLLTEFTVILHAAPVSRQIPLPQFKKGDNFAICNIISNVRSNTNYYSVRYDTITTMKVWAHFKIDAVKKSSSDISITIDSSELNFSEALLTEQYSINSIFTKDKWSSDPTATSNLMNIYFSSLTGNPITLRLGSSGNLQKAINFNKVKESILNKCIETGKITNAKIKDFYSNRIDSLFTIQNIYTLLGLNYIFPSASDTSDSSVLDFQYSFNQDKISLSTKLVWNPVDSGSFEYKFKTKQLTTGSFIDTVRYKYLAFNIKDSLNGSLVIDKNTGISSYMSIVIPFTLTETNYSGENSTQGYSLQELFCEKIAPAQEIVYSQPYFKRKAHFNSGRQVIICTNFDSSVTDSQRIKFILETLGSNSFEYNGPFISVKSLHSLHIPVYNGKLFSNIYIKDSLPLFMSDSISVFPYVCGSFKTASAFVTMGDSAVNRTYCNEINDQLKLKYPSSCKFFVPRIFNVIIAGDTIGNSTESVYSDYVSGRLSNHEAIQICSKAGIGISCLEYLFGTDTVNGALDSSFIRKVTLMEEWFKKRKEVAQVESIIPLLKRLKTITEKVNQFFTPEQLILNWKLLDRYDELKSLINDNASALRMVVWLNTNEENEALKLQKDARSYYNGL